jgi:membrane-associated protein
VQSLALMPTAIDPNHLLSSFGLLGLIVIIFAECGLLVGFFLPGDTLLFSAGLLTATGTLDIPLWVSLTLVPLAAVAGNLVGYWIGYRAGPAIFNKPDSRLFRQEYVERSHDFFEKYGARTIVLARFVPIVRTFATVMAGASRMRFATYALYSVIGGVLWGAGVIAAGYWLGHIKFVRDTVEPLIEPIIIGVVLLSLVPAAVQLLRSRRQGGGMTAEPLLDEPVETDGQVEHTGRHRADQARAE